MDESELEARLSRRLHARFDGGVASKELRNEVIASMTTHKPAGGRRPVRSSLFALPRQLLAAAAVVVVMVIAIVALTGRQSPVGGPTPSATAGTIPSASSSASPSASALPSASPGSSQPARTVPPISTAAWSGLTFHQLVGAPEISMVVPWSGGYIAIGQTSPTAPVGAWRSGDGRTWIQLPDATFGLDAPTGNTLIGGTACGDVVLVLTENGSSEADLIWSSGDGLTWSHTAAPIGGRLSIAGGRGGAVIYTATGGTVAPTGATVDFASDCSAWQPVTLAGQGSTTPVSVTTFGDGFAAVGSGPKGEPLAWTSTDGRQWTPAQVQKKPGDGFVRLFAGGEGLVAISNTLGLVPGQESFWTSSDGHAWKISTADPFGVHASGEGVGDPAGSFTGDGIRLLGWGTHLDTFGSPTEYWTSFDGEHWMKLALSGSGPTGLAGALQVFLVRDGILISGDAGTWFADAVTK